MKNAISVLQTVIVGNNKAVMKQSWSENIGGTINLCEYVS